MLSQIKIFITQFFVLILKLISKNFVFINIPFPELYQYQQWLKLNNQLLVLFIFKNNVIKTFLICIIIKLVGPLLLLNFPDIRSKYYK